MDNGTSRTEWYAPPPGFIELDREWPTEMRMSRDTLLDQRMGIVRRGASLPGDALAWLDRICVEATLFRRPAYLVELCPQCWRPVIEPGANVVAFTGKPGCACPETELRGDVYTAAALHGVAPALAFLRAADGEPNLARAD